MLFFKYQNTFYEIYRRIFPNLKKNKTMRETKINFYI